MTSRTAIEGPRFFAAPALEVARALIGCELRRGSTAALIVETEAYADDAASHAVTRSPSAGALMRETHGRAYVYSIYGMHLCLNVTADSGGTGAVLLRAALPTAGLAVLRRRRGGVRDLDLCRGPGRLAEAFGVSLAMNGRDFLSIFELGSPASAPDVVTGPRVGITKAADLPWRFALAGSPWVSSPRPR